MACAASTDGNDNTSEDDLTKLKDITVVETSMTTEGTITLAYEPDEYQNAKTRVPYLAIELPAASTSSTASLRPESGSMTMPLSVSVTGPFPSTPQIVVTDGAFQPIANVRGHTTADGAEAALQTTATPGKKFVLIRDKLWVKPMSFQVTIGR